mmetsp:Transcript_30409/g.33973  ORF Transcript_30409/g.33973 Transcript_30409/m.33973 type:complete len:205 (+) Transcript_30409:40-654(+)
MGDNHYLKPSCFFKIIVVGGGAVGKSAITIRYTSGHFVERYDPTIEDSYTKHTQVDENVAVLEILDTAGQEEYNAMREHYLQAGDGFLLVYSITSYPSFKELDNFVELILRVRDQDTLKGMPVVLAGNKCDLIEKRDVTTVEGKEWAEKWDIKNFYEVSAKEVINVNEAFSQIVRLVREERTKYFSGSSAFEKDAKKRKFCTVL